MAGAEDFVIAGYETCRRCGEWAVEGSLISRLCSECASELAHQAETVELAYEVDGRTVVSRPTRSRRRPTPTDPARKRAWNRARSRALLRVARVHRPLYEVILAQEKAKEGLDPRLDERVPGSAAIERELAS